MQPFAGAGMGLQFTPRIGQEVLLNFIDDDLERPFVVAALYTGRGEGGINPTPGGQTSSSNQSDPGVFAQSSDHRPSGQGNLTGGNSPAWHGAAAAAADIAAGGQNNAGALSGWKTKEFNGQGFNQLVFDDTPQQLRAQLATTQHATQLNLGHLIHQADNHRGSFRGLGFELRTDAYGTVRGAQGVLISSYGIQPSEPAGDNAAGMALASQFKNLSQTFSDAAKTHQTVQLASAIGSVKASQSALSDKEAPASDAHRAQGHGQRSKPGASDCRCGRQEHGHARQAAPHHRPDHRDLGQGGADAERGAGHPMGRRRNDHAGIRPGHELRGRRRAAHPQRASDRGAGRRGGTGSRGCRHGHHADRGQR